MVLELMPAKWERMRLLDLGIGDGFTIRLIKREGDVSGVDIDPVAVSRARLRGIDAKVGTAYEVPFPDDSFGIVTSIEVLEHLEDPVSAIKEANRVLKQGGILLVTTPIPSTLWNVLWRVWSTIGPGKVWAHTPHVNSFRVWEDSGSELGLASTLGRKGFAIDKVASCNYGMIVGVRAVKAR
jgi:SAM-dependent methyltransferase